MPTVLKWISFLIGAGLALAAVVSWRIPGGHGELGADVAFFAAPPAELASKPSGIFLNGRDLKPSAPSRGASGELRVTNQTGESLAVHVRVPPDSPALDRLLWVRLAVGDRPFFEGRIGLLRRWTPDAFRLGVGKSTTLEAHAWLPPGTRGYRGRIMSATLGFRSDEDRSSA